MDSHHGETFHKCSFLRPYTGIFKSPFGNNNTICLGFEPRELEETKQVAQLGVFLVVCFCGFILAKIKHAIFTMAGRAENFISSGTANISCLLYCTYSDVYSLIPYGWVILRKLVLQPHHCSQISCLFLQKDTGFLQDLYHICQPCEAVLRTFSCLDSRVKPYENIRAWPENIIKYQSMSNGGWPRWWNTSRGRHIRRSWGHLVFILQKDEGWPHHSLHKAGSSGKGADLRSLVTTTRTHGKRMKLFQEKFRWNRSLEQVL